VEFQSKVIRIKIIHQLVDFHSIASSSNIDDMMLIKIWKANKTAILGLA